MNCHLWVEGNCRTLGHMIRDLVKLDVCVVTETWLKEEEEHVARVALRQSGYEWVGVERKGRRGGGIGVKGWSGQGEG